MSDIELDEHVYATIKAYAKLYYPREMCGVIVNGLFEPCKNVADEPETTFKLCSEGYLRAAEKGDIQAIVHSHVNGNGSPSKQDMISQIETGLPWLIVVHDGDAEIDRFWFGGEAPADFNGLVFRYGVYDCFSLTRFILNYKFNIELPDLPREENEDFSGVFTEYAKENGFRLLTPDEPQRMDDVFMMRVGSKTPNHIGVYVGVGQIAHHLKDMKSGMFDLKKWQDRIDGWWRYEPSDEIARKHGA